MPTPLLQRVRIIGGRFRGRVIRFPKAADLRPTPDRVRETLFNWLGQDLSELTVLDLFAGSGALALESRRFDVIFLDPPFATDEWAWLLPACVARLAGGGALYAEARHLLVPPPGLAVHRHARAGQVHYHLLRHADTPLESP